MLFPFFKYNPNHNNKLVFEYFKRSELCKCTERISLHIHPVAALKLITLPY